MLAWQPAKGVQTCGRHLEQLGDLNGDGLGELVFGAVETSSCPSSIDEPWIVSVEALGRGTGFLHLPPAKLTTRYDIDQQDALAISLAGIGDSDGGGVGDLAAGAPLADDGSSDAGAFYLFRRSDGDPDAASIPSSVTTGCPPFSVDSQDVSNGARISSWFWDFGDGSGST